MPVTITQQDMNLIFEVTDSLGVHREKIRVGLTKKDPGSVRKDAKGVFEITAPETGLDIWLKDLSPTLQTLGVEHV